MITLERVIHQKITSDKSCEKIKCTIKIDYKVELRKKPIVKKLNLV